MKYFTRDELEDITKGLLENPTRETLNNLNKKYNRSIETETLTTTVPAVESPVVETTPVVEESAPSVIQPVEVSAPTNSEPVINQVPNVNIPSVEIPKIDNSPINNVSVPSSELPSFELPALNTQTSSVQSNAPINFTGNLFETGQPVANLMQTTDNFNPVQNTMPTTEVPVSGTPFFGPHIAVENNQIPVAGPVNNMPTNQPSMFGQFEQNHM